jgi:hypothetical protein
MDKLFSISKRLKQFKKPAYYLIQALIVIAVVTAVIYAWQEPTEQPPGGNIAAPLNVGDTPQRKTGGLCIGGSGACTAGAGEVKVESGGKITFSDGTSLTSAAGLLWKKQSGTNNIYYDLGNVGIGTTTNPGAKLEVAGDVKITGVLAASPRIYLVEKNTKERLRATSWTNYITQTITVDKDNSNVLFIFSFSQPYETDFPSVVWRVGLDNTYSNAKYYKYATSNWNVLPGGFSFLMTGVNAGTYTAKLQYKFYSGEWNMSYNYQSEAYNSLIIIVL